MNGPAATPDYLRMAFALCEAEPGSLPTAQVLVEAVGPSYPLLLDHAYESGFLLCLGEPPQTTAEVHLFEGVFTALTLLGGRNVWSTGLPVPLTDTWLAAAAAYGTAVVEIVPPGTWPAHSAELTDAVRLDAFNTRLRTAVRTGTVLHGAAAVVGL